MNQLVVSLCAEPEDQNIAYDSVKGFLNRVSGRTFAHVEKITESERGVTQEKIGHNAAMRLKDSKIKFYGDLEQCLH